MSIVGPAVIALTRRPPQELSLLYIGTASYDISESRHKQTEEFIRMGVTVKSLDVANKFLHRHEMEEAVNEADIILVSGGNTLYAVDRWERLGLSDLLRDAALRGTVIAGGSAGAICWFDGGHSDSMDPKTHRLFKLNGVCKSDDSTESFHVEAGRSNSSFIAECTSYNETEKNSKKRQLTRKVSFDTDMESDAESDMEMDEGSSVNDWEYIRVEGLGIFPGIICPHHDCIQSNGLLRSNDFKSMMKRHPYEVGIGIDNFAALEFDGSNFRVLTMLRETSPQIKDGVGKVPGVWINYVDDHGMVHSERCPQAGKVADLLQMLKDPAKHLLLDNRVDVCRRRNPQLQSII
jgi:dipeptidase E